MRLQKRYIPLFFISLLLTACGGCEEQTGGQRKKADGLGLPEKQTMTGVVGICSTSDDIELILQDSSSVFVEAFNKVIYGSCEPGDSIHVTYMDIDGHLLSSVVVNLRQMANNWQALPDSTGDYLSVELLNDNHMRTHINEESNDQYIQWNLFDGQLLLTSQADSLQPVTVDTFNILSLSDDSLVLQKENNHIIYIKRK